MANQAELNKEALFEACKKLVKHILWQTPLPQDISDIIDTEQIRKTTRKYFEEALRHVEFIVEHKRDPNLITRAILYLSQAHAIPPMKEDLTWFSNMLEAVIELACPNTIHSKETAQFLSDIEEGIRGIRKDMGKK